MTSAAAGHRYRLAVEAGAEISSALAGRDAPATIARRVAQALDVWECDLLEYDPVSRTLTGTAIWTRRPTAEDEAWVGITFGLDDRPGYAPVIEGGRSVVTRLGNPHLDASDRAAMLEWGEREALAVPLRFRDRGVVGCLTLIEKREERSFTDEDVELAELLAAPAAVAVRNARLFRLQVEQNRYLASLLETGRSIATSTTLEDSLARICSTAAQALATDECVVYEYDGARDAIVCRAFYGAQGTPPLLDERGVYPLDDYPSDREILRRGEIVQETLSDPGLADDVRDSMDHWGEQACLNVPLAFEGRPVGLLVLIETTRERVFTAGEIEFASALGEQAATAIRHGQLYRRRERQNRRLAALLETSRVLASSLDVSAVLVEVRREVAGLFGVSGDAVGLLLCRGEAYVPFAPPPRAPDHALPLPTDDGQPVDLDELQLRAVSELAPAADADRSRLVVPFLNGGGAEGLLDLRAAGAVGDDEIELLQVLAGQAAAALANAALYRTLERQAITDGLTGLYSHRYFYERLNQEIARAQRYGLPLSLLMIDIDDFKRFNDRFGHPAGDLVLREVGRILGTQIRAGVDIAARYGGEEFAVVLPNTPRSGAQVVGARLVEHLSALPGTPPRGEGAAEVGEGIRVAVAGSDLPGVDPAERITVSVGVASCPGAGGGPGELVRNADKALYLAKRLGKNRVEVYGD